MKIFVTGATGFIGKALIERLLSSGHEITALLRPSEAGPVLGNPVSRVEGESTLGGKWQDLVAECDGAVNLAGHPIFGRWTANKKREIRESRILTTRNLVEAIPSGKNFRLISTSAVGYYGDGGESILDESASPGSDFLASVAVEWEKEAAKAAEKGASVALARFGVVLARGGGALAQLERVTKLCLSGPMGEGKQWFSWIHRQDLTKALEFLLEHQGITGPVNMSAPNPVRQKSLAKELGRILCRPAVTPAPAFAVKLLLGEFSDTVLFSQRMKPERLLSEGYGFDFPDLQTALEDLYTD